jgi:hypothetical protein
MTDVKFVGISVTMEGYGHRAVFKVTRRGQVVGYVARSVTAGAPARAGWSYCRCDRPEKASSWIPAGPGSTRDDAATLCVDTTWA